MATDILGISFDAHGSSWGVEPNPDICEYFGYLFCNKNILPVAATLI